MNNHSSSDRSNNLHQNALHRFSNVHSQDQSEASDPSGKTNDRKVFDPKNSVGLNSNNEIGTGSDGSKDISSAATGNYRRHVFGQRAGSPLIGSQSKPKVNSVGNSGVTDACEDGVNSTSTAPYTNPEDKNTGSSRPSYKRFRSEPTNTIFTSSGKNANGLLDNGNIGNDDGDDSDFDNIDEPAVSSGLPQFNRLQVAGVRHVHGDVGEDSPEDERSALLIRPRRDAGFSDFEAAAASDIEGIYRGRQRRQGYRPQAYRRRDLSLNAYTTNTGAALGQQYPVCTTSRSFYLPAGGGTLPRRQPYLNSGLTRATTIGGADYPLHAGAAGTLHSPIPLLHRPMLSSATMAGVIPPPPSEPPPATPMSGSIMSDGGVGAPGINPTASPFLNASAVGPLYPQQGFIYQPTTPGILPSQQHAVWASAANPVNTAYLLNPNLSDASQLLQLQLLQQQQQQQQHQLAVNNLMLESQLSQPGQPQQMFAANLMQAHGPGAYISNYGTLGRPAGRAHLLDDSSSLYLSAAALLSAQQQQQQYLAGVAVGPQTGQLGLASASQADSQMEGSNTIATTTNNNNHSGSNSTGVGMQLCRSPGGMVYENSYNSFRRIIPQTSSQDGFQTGLMTNSASGLTDSLVAQQQQQQVSAQDAQLLHATAVLNAAAAASSHQQQVGARIVEPTYVAHPMLGELGKGGGDVFVANSTAGATIERKSTRGGLRCPWYAWIIAVLFTAFLLAMVVAVVFSAEKRRLDRRLLERFAQDPAIIGLFNPENPPAQITAEKPVDLVLPPLGVWTGQWRLSETRFVRYNLTVASALASIGVFLRQNTMPTIVRYDIFDHISGRGLKPPAATSVGGPLANAGFERRARVRRSVDAESFRRRVTRSHSALSPSSGGYENSGSRQTSRIHYLEDGIWFFALVNDQPRQEPVTFSIGNAVMDHGCPNGCSNRGVCNRGNCDCVNGFKGPDCSIAEMPKICNGHGDYTSGVCRCYPEWKGPECSVIWSDCLDPVCSGHGHCVTGTCHCYQGYEGETCATRTCPAVNCSNNGVCSDGQCRCFSGFSGPACDLPVPVMQTAGLLAPASRTDHSASGQRPEANSHRAANDVPVSMALRDTAGVADCPIDCGPQGHCELDPGTNVAYCRCRSGWSGDRCSQRNCDSRCSQHGHCENGTCVCHPGWYGKHCSLDGCPGQCSSVGQCLASTGAQDQLSQFACQCPIDRKGTVCQAGVELDCADGLDNDGDNLIDCLDPDCCGSPHCKRLQAGEGKAAEIAQQCCAHSDSFDRHILITPVAPPGSTFYGQLEFLLHREQIVANNFDPRRISVIRGTIRQWDGTPLWGCRIADRRNMRSGYTLTDTLGRFDLPVEGGSIVQLELLRYPTDRFYATLSVYVPVNEIVNMGEFYMQDIRHPPFPESVAVLVSWWNRSLTTSFGGLHAPSPIGHDLWTNSLDTHVGGERRSGRPGGHTPATQTTDCPALHDIVAMGEPVVLGDVDRVRKTVCIDQDGEICVADGVLTYRIPLRDIRLHLVYRSNRALGHRPALVIRILADNRAPPENLKEIHLVVDVAGLRHVRRLEPEAGLTELFYWNRTDGYNRTVYGLTTAQISIGYVYPHCGGHQVFWERRAAQLEGEELSSAELANWNLDVVHSYAVNHDIVYRGDGDHIYLRRTDWHVTSILGVPGKTRWCQPGGETCSSCSSPTAPAYTSRLGRVHALLSDSKGHLVVGDGAFIRVLHSSGSQSGPVQREHKSYTNSELLNYRARQAIASDDRTVWLAKSHIFLEGLDKKFSLDQVKGSAYWMAAHPTFSVETLDKVTGLTVEETGMLISHTASQTLWWVSGTSQSSSSGDQLTPNIRPLISHRCRLVVSLFGEEASEQAKKTCFSRPFDEPRGVAVSATHIYVVDTALILRVDIGVIETRSVGYSSKPVVGRMDIPLPPPACDSSVSGDRMRLQTPTDLLYSSMEDALYIVDGKHVYRYHITSRMVSLAAGRLPHCPVKVSELGSSVPLATEFDFTEVRGIAISPQGELYIAEPHRIWLRKADARLHAVVGGHSASPPSTGDQYNNRSRGDATAADAASTPTAPLRGPAADFHFQDITAISVSIYGELFVMDANRTVVLRIHHQPAGRVDTGAAAEDQRPNAPDLSAPASAAPSSFRVVSKATDEAFLFNRHGQLTATETAETGLTLHRMEYRTNANLGWLTQIQGNTVGLRLRLHRDTQGKLLRILLPTGLVYNTTVETGSRPQISQLTDPFAGGHWHFVYSPSGLLTEVKRPGGDRTRFRYDPVSGRLTSLVLVDGSLVETAPTELPPTDLSGSPRTTGSSVHLLALNQESRLASGCRLLQSTDSSSLQTAFGGPDNRWTIDIGRRYQSDPMSGFRQLQLFRHIQLPDRPSQPLLEHTSLWTVNLKSGGRSRLLPEGVDAADLSRLQSHRQLASGEQVDDLPTASSEWRYQKNLSINGHELLRVTFDWARQLETYYFHQTGAGPGQVLLQIVYNANLQPMIFNASAVDLQAAGEAVADQSVGAGRGGQLSGDLLRLPVSAPAPLSLTYTSNGQLNMFHWGSAIFRFTYDPMNRLTTADLGSPTDRITFQYTNARTPQQPSVVSVSGSGQYKLVYSTQPLRPGEAPVTELSGEFASAYSSTSERQSPVAAPGLWRVVTPTGLRREVHRILGVGVYQLIFSPWPGSAWTYEWSGLGTGRWFQFSWPKGYRRVAVRLAQPAVVRAQRETEMEPNQLIYDQTLVEWWQTLFTCPDTSALYADQPRWATELRMHDPSTGFRVSLMRRFRGSLVTAVNQRFRVPGASSVHPQLGGLLNVQLNYAYNSLLKVNSIRTQLFTTQSQSSRANHLLMLDETTVVKYDAATGQVLGLGNFDVSHQPSAVCLAYSPKDLHLCRHWDAQGRLQQVVLFSLAGHRDPVYNLSLSYPTTGLDASRQREEQRGQVPRWLNLGQGPGGRLERVEREEAGSSLRSHSELVYNADGRVSLLRVAMSDPQSPHLMMNTGGGGDFASSVRSEERQFIYDRRGLLLRRGNWDYRFDEEGFLTERRLESQAQAITDRFAHNSKGLLTWAERTLLQPAKSQASAGDSLGGFHRSPIDDHVGMMSPFRVQFLYDAEDRLVLVRDTLVLKDLVQYFYSDPEHPSRITHIFDHGRLATLKLSYDPVRGHVFAVEEFSSPGRPEASSPAATSAPDGYNNNSNTSSSKGQQALKRVYFIITNHEGTPTGMFSEDGKTVWTAEYSITGSRRLTLPNRNQLFGNSVFEEELGIPLGFSGCPMDVHTGLLFCPPTGRAFDPLGATFTSPDWQGLLSHRLTGLLRDPSLLDTHKFGTWEQESLGIGSPGLLHCVRSSALRSPGWWLQQVGFNLDHLMGSPQTDMCTGSLADSTGRAWYRPVWSSPNGGQTLGGAQSASACSAGLPPFGPVDERQRWNAKIEQLSAIPTSRLTPGDGETGSGLPWQLDQRKGGQGLLLLPAQTMFGSALQAVLDSQGFVSILQPLPETSSPSPGVFTLANHLLSGARLLDWWTETPDWVPDSRLPRGPVNPRLVQLFLRLPCSFDELMAITGGHELPLHDTPVNVTGVRMPNGPPEVWLTSLRSDIQWRVRCAAAGSLTPQLLNQVLLEAEHRGHRAAWQHEHQLIRHLIPPHRTGIPASAPLLPRLGVGTTRYLMGLHHVWTRAEVDQLAEGDFDQLAQNYEWRSSVLSQDTGGGSRGNTSADTWAGALATARLYDNPGAYQIRPKLPGQAKKSPAVQSGG